MRVYIYSYTLNSGEFSYEIYIIFTYKYFITIYWIAFSWTRGLYVQSYQCIYVCMCQI